MNPLPKRSEFLFEVLEPRLLLSAEGLNSVLGCDSIVDRDPLVDDFAPVAVAYATEGDSGSAIDQQASASTNGIFDVSDQPMLQTDDSIGATDEEIVQASVEVLGGTDAAANATEPIAMASVFDGASAAAQQLIETLDAANGPPAGVDGSSVESSILSITPADETTVLQSQDLSVFPDGVGSAVPPMLASELENAVAEAMRLGLSLLGDRIEGFLRDDALLGDRVPLLLKVGKDAMGNPVFEAPTVLDLLSVPVDANGDGLPGAVDGDWDAVTVDDDDDDDEGVLLLIDAAGNGNGIVDPGEFLQYWFFDRVEAYLATMPAGATTEDFIDFLKDDPDLDETLNDLSDLYEVHIEVVETKVADTTEDPDAEVTIKVGVRLTIEQTLPIDLGLSADALKIMAFTGTAEDPKIPDVPVTSTLELAFEFGVFTGGQAVNSADDFFVRYAEPIKASIVAEEADPAGFLLNVGFLGAMVNGYTLDLQADVLTQLLDPNDPVVLGFTVAQRGVEGTNGIVTATNPPATVPTDHSAGFFLRIGNLGIATPVTVVDDNPDVADTAEDIRDDVAAALVTAGLDNLVSVSLVGGKIKLTLAPTSNTPLGFANDTYAIDGTAITTILLSTPDGNGGNIFEYISDQTFWLSIDGALPILVRVNFRDPSHTDIGLNNAQVASVPPLVAPSAASSFDISANAGLTITVWINDGTNLDYIIGLTDTDTDGNTSAADLAADLHAKLPGGALVGISANGDGHMVVTAADATVCAVRVVASGTAVSEIGFAASAIHGLQLLAANDGIADLTEAAHFKLTLNSGGTVTTYTIIVPDMNRASLAALAVDIDNAIDSAVGGLNRINAVVSGDQILLAGVDTGVRAFSVVTINENIDDLVLDVNRALATANLSADVIASAAGGQLQLAAAAGHVSLEITHTLTFDAGVTYAELKYPLSGGTSTDDLFGASVGGASKIEMVLPVHVLNGLYDEIGGLANWNPADVAIVANFDPFDSAAAVFDDTVSVNRFDLIFTYTPEVTDQDTSVAMPAIGDLNNQVRLVNFAELLNFNALSADTVIGLLGGLGTALQQLSQTAPLAGFDIPFADATLSDLLNFADSDKARYSGLIDILIYDTGGDGVDPGTGVVNDDDGLMKWAAQNGTSYLLPAFTTAQTLATRLRDLLDRPLTGAGGINATYDTVTNELTYKVDLAANDDTSVVTTVPFEHDVSLDEAITKLTVDSSKPLPEISVTLRGRTGLDMTFGIDLSPPGVVIYPTTPLADLNGGDGVDISAVRAVTGETGVRSIYGITKDSEFKISVDGGPQYSVKLTAASTANNSTIGHLVNDLQNAIDAALLGTLAEGTIQVGVDAATSTRLGMQHAVAGHTFQIFVSPTDPLVAEIGFPNKITGGVPQAYGIFIATKAAPLLVGRLSAVTSEAAGLRIEVLNDGNGHAIAPITVTITAEATANNRTISDLVADVNNALVVAGLGHVIKAGFDGTTVGGQRLVLYGQALSASVDSRSIEFTVYATTAKAKDELGIPFAAAIANQHDFVIYDTSGVAHPIVLDPTGLDRTDPLYDPLHGLPNDPTVEDVINVINAWFPDPDAGGPLPPLIEASLNGLHTGLRLIANQAGPEQFRVETINASGALLGIGLFLTGDDALPDTFGTGNPNLIEGGAIGLKHIDDRFFVRDARMRIDGLSVTTPMAGVPGGGLYGIVGIHTDVAGQLMANVTASLSDPGGETINQITLSELLGRRVELEYVNQASGEEFQIGGVVTTAAGDSATIIGIKNDSGAGDASGILVLANVTGVFSDTELLTQKFSETLSATAEADSSTVRLANPQVSKVRELGFTYVPFSAAFSVGDVVQGIVSGATAVIIGIQPNKLQLANVNGSFSDTEILELFTNGVSAVQAFANGTATTAPDFGTFSLTVNVQRGFEDAAFDPDFQALDDAAYVLPFTLDNFGNPFTPTAPNTSALNLSLLGELRLLDKLSYTHFAAVLGELLRVIESVQANFGALTTLLPAINRTVSDLLSLVGAFERGVDNAAAGLDLAIEAIGPTGYGMPPLRLQDMGRALRGAFGLPDDINPYSAGVVDWVRLDYNTVADELLLSFQLHEEVSTKLGLDIDPGGGAPHLTSAGVLEVRGQLDTRLDVAISLLAPANAYLLNTTRIDGELHVRGEGQEYATGDDGLGLVFRSALGPLAVFIQDGDARIDFVFSLPGMNLGADGRELLADVEFTHFKAPVISENVIDIVLPMFFGGEGPDDFFGEYKATGTVSLPAVQQPPFSEITASITGDELYDPFDNILLGIDALNLYLELLSDQLSAEVLGIDLPFVGDQMADVLFIENFRRALVRTLKSGIENAINPDPDTIITTLLNSVFNPGGALAGFLIGSIDDTQLNLAGPSDTRYRQWSFTVGHTGANADTITIDDFDIGPEHLGFDIKVPVKVKVAWSIKIVFGVNYGDGAYIGVSDSNEIDVDMTIQMPANMATVSYTGELGFLRFQITDPGSDSGARVFFDIDVKNGETTEARLGFADLGNLNPVATIEGKRLEDSTPLAATFSLVSDASSAIGLPTLTGQFVFDWVLEKQGVKALAGDAVTPGIQLIQLNSMTLDPVSVAKQLLGPAFDEIIQYIEPFMPVLDVITAPIPILSDLAGEPFTILDLAAIFGDVDPRFIEAVADILDVIIAVRDLATMPPLQLGSLTLFQKGSVTNFDPTDPTSKKPSEILINLAGTPGLTHDATAWDARMHDGGFLQAVFEQTLAEGLTMPILTDAAQGIMLMLGNSKATLVEYELPPLGVSFEYLQTFPIWGPLAVSIEISFGFTIDLHAIGFDTFGYERYSDSGFRNPGLIFDGFYFDDEEPEGVDAPEITFEFGLVGAVELNLGIARAGVGGGIEATINFDWHDPIVDGHVHISEIVGNVIAAEGNPLAVFDLSGALTFELFAFLEIKLLGIDERFPITPKTELFSFDVEFYRRPLLATQSEDGKTLYLNIGPNAADRLNGNTSDGNETLSLSYSGGTVKVWSQLLGVDSGDAWEFTGVEHIIGLGGQGNDIITLDGFDGSHITADFDGGPGDDRIEYINTSASNSWPGAHIVGGLGNDTLTGGDANDIIYGGEGNDTINGSGGYDILFGDQGRVASSADVPFITSRITESDGADTIDGGAGDDVVIGAGGSDVLRGGADSDLIIGDGGRFEYTMTGGHINVVSLRPAPIPATSVSVYKDPAIISNDIDAVLDAVLDKIHATDLGVGGNDEIYGDAGDDLVLGGTGDDVIQGNAGDDILLGGKGFDLIFGGANADYIFGGDQADSLFGGPGNDVMSGGAGNDFMHGDGDDDVMKGDTGGDVMFGDTGDDQVFGQTEPDVLFGGADNDLVVGGTSNDVMFGDDGLVVKIDPNILDGTDDGRYIGLGGGSLVSGAFLDNDIRTIDLIITDVRANDGNDFMSGDAGDDLMFGGGGNDRMGGDVDPRLPSAGEDTSISEDVLIGDGGHVTFDHRRFKKIETVIGVEDVDANVDGSPFNDVIYGDNGNDYIFGGRGSDVLFGGHGKVVTNVTTQTLGAFRGETDAFARDNDIIVGDNGEMWFADGTVEGNYGRLEKVNTTDESNVTGGHEYVEGELGNDVIFGGVNGSIDVLHGNDGSDVILGDNGELDFALGSDTDLNTLDLISSYRDGLGGTDIISGDQADDVLIGGTGADIMYGDDATASHGALDGEDIMLGDNGDVLLINDPAYDPATDDILDFGRLIVHVAATLHPTTVDLIRTTDKVDAAHPTLALAEAVGGGDTMSGNAWADIMLGGVNNGEQDYMFGDRGDRNATYNTAADDQDPTPATIALDGDDILLGDNGILDFTYDPANYPGDEPGAADTDRRTLDLIRSNEDALGGTDNVSGNKGLDVAIGGTGGDIIYGNDRHASGADADLGDLLLGDNADIFLVAVAGATGGDLKVVLDAAVKTIVTTDEAYDPAVPDKNTGGVDTISGNADADIIAGGVEGDYLYGDREFPNVETTGDDGDDMILGDNGAFEWLSNGRLAEILGINILINNYELFNWFTDGEGDPVADIDLTTLDLITTEQPTNGGRDYIYGDEGNDVVFGGTDLDTIYGDDGNETGTVTNNDVLFGDHGRLYPHFARYQLPNSTELVPADFASRNFFAIHTGDLDGGEGDIMRGEEGDDLMFGQQGDDRMWGGSEDDDMTGGHNVAGGYDELTAPAVDAELNPPSAFMVNDLMDGGSGDDAMTGDNAIVWRRGDDYSPRFRVLEDGKTAIYTTGPDQVDTIVTNIDTLWQSDPEDAVGRDIQILDHSDAVEATPDGRYGSDVMAGGPDNDVMFGELGDDLIQGDGLIDITAVGSPYVSHVLGVTDDGVDPGTDETLYFSIPELGTDANDFIEGSGGNDLIYGGLGQDDIIGGSSNLFGLDAFNAALLGVAEEWLRPDGSDTIFGGAGIDIGRNAIGDAIENGTTHVITTNPAGHARDADFIMGDNASVYRLVNAVGDTFLEFNYDQSFSTANGSEDRGDERIIVRAMEQLDYTLGGSDYAGGAYVNGAADIDGAAGPIAPDNGAADLIHGEAGDDFVFGMTGSDVIFGEGQDDDIVGGYGNDWISGGTGQDGILGDDGLIYTSRNSTLGEPLNSVAALLAKDPSTKYSNGTALDELIATPGDIQIAVINVSGALKKTADLVPFSFDPAWLGMDDEFPDDATNKPFADDIIFGGLGSDFLHGGSGDDAISGAEALSHAYVPVFAAGVPVGILDLGYNAFDLSDPILPGDLLALNPNPGNVLAFNPVDINGQHLNNRYRAGEFFLYDEYDPRRKIMLDDTGNLWKPDSLTGPFEFVLNFDEAEGVVRPAGTVPKATGQQTESYLQVNDDGKDAIFGDNGNDWLVGGTGRDDIYGGWGNDLLNADDKHSITDDSTKTGTVTDTHPTFEDRAYGGAGRDVLIGNTGGDRLIDWVGEYNTYLVPYAPFGQASVSRTLQPFLPEYLYALSAGDGADFTRYTDAVSTAVPEPTTNNPIPTRNGEPHGELGLVLQKDYAWQDQTGAPADPQAGNIPGGARDVLRTASFNDGTSDGFFADSGTWSVKNGAYTVAPTTKGSDALTVFYVDSYIPSYFEMMATLNPVKPTAGYKANAYIVFDYQSDTDFKFAGIDVSTSKLVIGHRTEAGWIVDVQGVYPGSLKAGTNYNVFLALNGSNVILRVDNKVTLTYTFAPRIDPFGIAHGLHDGMVGLGAENSKATIDNMIVQRLAPVMTYVRTVDFSAGLTELLEAPTSGAWGIGAGRLAGIPMGAEVALDLVAVHPAPAAVIDFLGVLSVSASGGFVFDYYNPAAFKFVLFNSVSGEITLGHRTAKGWFTDAVYINATLKATADQALGLTIKGTTVSVKWGTQLVISYSFNALVTDGSLGLLSKSGTTSFDLIKFQTDDPNLNGSATTTEVASYGSVSAAALACDPELSTTGVLATSSPSELSSPEVQGPVTGSVVNSILGAMDLWSFPINSGETLALMGRFAVSADTGLLVPGLASVMRLDSSGPSFRLAWFGGTLDP